MARKKQDGEVNKSQSIRDLLKENPNIKASEAVSILAQKGITIKSGLFYIVKGKQLGKKSRRRHVQANAVNMAAVSGSGDALATILKVKKFAAEVGGLHTLKKLVDALSE